MVEKIPLRFSVLLLSPAVQVQVRRRCLDALRSTFLCPKQYLYKIKAYPPILIVLVQVKIKYLN
jgi:hypothetical protein